MSRNQLAVLTLLIGFALPLCAQTVWLPERWRFTFGDNSAYSSPAFPDSGWMSMNVPSWWENEGYPTYDGFAWYRTAFTLNRRTAGRQFYLFLGKIDDVDEVFLNGTKIGQTGSFPPNYETAWNVPRMYKIPLNLLRAANVLAVRVYDSMGAGGIVSGPLGLYNQKEYDWFTNPPPGPKKSFFQPVAANGLIAAVYNEKRGMIETVRPHIFQMYDSAQAVKPFLAKVAPTITLQPLRTRYRQNTHVVTVTYPQQIEVSYFAPFTTPEKVFYAVVRGPAAAVRTCAFRWEEREAALLVDSALFVRPQGRAEKYYLFGFMDSLHRDRAVVRNAKERLAAGGGALLDDEVRWMREVIGTAHIPRGVTPKERNVLEQSVSVFKMGQVRPQEIFPKSPGQILASLPPGSWNISWVRDGAYAVLGMNRLRMFDEVRSFLEFCLNAESGRYVRYIHTDGKDYGIGVPYQVSVTRYFGIGKEESDFNDNGPNIELDDFGLFLTGFCDYVTRSGDSAFFRAEYGRVSRLVADAIVHNIDTNDVIRRDSGPWERHLPGKVFAYPSITCAAGLRDFAELSRRFGTGEPERYRQAFERLLAGIRRNFVVNNSHLKGNTEATDPGLYDYFDGGTVEAFGMKLLTEKGLFSSHFRAYDRGLRVEGKGRGYARINKGDWYETAEWILMNLRTASVFDAFGEPRKARELVDWVTDQAALNFNLIPEMYALKTAFYDGAIPMIGFGAGAYAVTMSDLYE